MGVPKNEGFIIDNPMKIWMIYRGNPMTLETYTSRHMEVS